VTTDFVLDASTAITLFLDDEAAHMVAPVLRAVRDGRAGRITLALFNQMREDIAAMIASRQNAALETTHA
jgi:hypothetical protein